MRTAGPETFPGHLEKGQIRWEGSRGSYDSWQVRDKGSVCESP